MSSDARDVASGEPPCVRRRTTDFGLVVGVEHYPQFRMLQGAITDAKNFHTWMCEKEGGGVNPQHAHLILSTADPARPIHSQIDETLVELLEAADELGGGRRLYFYFSGHGATCVDGPSDDVALLLATWSRRFARVALSSKAYRGELATIGLFEEVVIFLDCCRCEAKRVVGLPPTMTPELKSDRFPTREFIAYATEAGHSAFETSDDQLWQGVFTRHLTSILRRSVRGITASDLKEALECEMASAGQQAHVVNELRRDSTFGVRGIPAQLEIRFTRATGRVCLRDGGLELIAERDTGPEPWRLVLQAGLYILEGGDRASFVFQHGHMLETCVEF